MNPTGNVNTQSSKKSLSMILKEQPQLYDLHTHLLGMGNSGFWIDTILMDKFIMPTHETFKKDEYIRETLCPLVWDKEKDGFVNSKKAAKFFHFLINKNIFRKVNGKTTETVDYEEALKSLIKEKFSSFLVELLTEKLYDDMIHGGLQFKYDFSYDVVLELSDLGKSLGIKDSDCEGFVQLAVVEKLGCHLPDRRTNFRHWIVFNAKEQKFKIVYGIQVDSLRKLIYMDNNKPSEAAKLARAHIINAFSMCNAEGTRARPIDLHSFHGFFTPHFYPHRFALKDSIYSQRLDILAALIIHIIERYQTCLPPVKYCEFSVSVNDLSKPWILDVLRSVRIYNQTAIQRSQQSSTSHVHAADDELSSFSQIVLNGGFPHLQVAFTGPKCSNRDKIDSNLPSVTYKFLAGFNRQNIKAPFPVNQDEALRLLYNAPHEAILLMMEEIKKSKSDAAISDMNINENQTTSSEDKKDEEMGFDTFLQQLTRLEIASEITWFHKWVVGLDLFGDELGYPYCPFVARPFIKFISSQRESKNKYFGVRIHCGENVKFASDDNPAYRLFIAHMYITFRSLLFLQQELNYGIRIGHGIAFDHILGANLNLSKYRKSSVLMAEMRNNAYYLFKKIAFEVNITSNEYLLGQTLRKGDYSQILCLKELFDMEAHITLGTDDDGIWPIDQCSSVHPGHQSLAAEYCRAISTGLIDSKENLERTFETMKKFCFWDINDEMQRSFIKDANSNNNPCMNTVIVHPDIIRLIHNEYTTAERPLTKNPALQNFQIYSENTGGYEPITWTNQYSKVRVAFVCICASQEDDKEKLREEYENLFRSSSNAALEFDFIYNNWKSIYSSFVLCESDADLEIRLSDNQNKQILNVIRSAQSQSEDSLNFLEKICWLEREINIRAYVPQMTNEKTINTFNERISKAPDAQLGKGTLYIFTNTKKYVFSYSKHHKNVTCQVNPTPSRRDTNDENFIYVLCHHTSAATAALHLLSEQLPKLIHYPPTSPDSLLVASAANLVYAENTDKQTTTARKPSTPIESVSNAVHIQSDNAPETTHTIDDNNTNGKRRYSHDDNVIENDAKQAKITEQEM